MKTKLLVILSGLLLTNTLLICEPVKADLSANVAMTNEYRYRGISQSDKSFAIQGGLDYENDSGFYAGVWASNVDFQIQTVDDASSELDIYAGWGGELSESGVNWTLGVLHYNYPNADTSLNYNFTEVNASLSYSLITLFYAHTSDYFGGSGTADYLNVAVDYEFADDWSAGASIGFQSVSENATWGTPDWNDYKLYLGKNYQGLDFEVAYIDTDLSDSECFGGSDWCSGTVTVAISKSF